MITDLVMPQLDGFELLRVIRRHYPDLPVIVMTAYGNESIAVKALEAGAASYVPKAQRAERLMETVERVLSRCEAERRRARLAGSITELRCRYCLENDTALIAPLIDEIQQRLAGTCIRDANERIRTAMALEEAILNAMYHGNLEITEEETHRARAQALPGQLVDVVEERRERPKYQLRRVVVDVHITATGATFCVRDDGPGFDMAAMVRRTDSDCFESGWGRGLSLIHRLMDKVSYNAVGNEVTLVKRAR